MATAQAIQGYTLEFSMVPRPAMPCPASSSRAVNWTAGKLRILENKFSKEIAHRPKIIQLDALIGNSMESRKTESNRNQVEAEQIVDTHVQHEHEEIIHVPAIIQQERNTHQQFQTMVEIPYGLLDKEEEMFESFEVLDRSGSGSVGAAELRQVMTNLDGSLSDGDLNATLWGWTRAISTTRSSSSTSSRSLNEVATTPLVRRSWTT